MKAFYDYNNELIGTTTPVSYADLPAIARKYIEKHLSNYTTQSVILFDDNEYNQSDMRIIRQYIYRCRQLFCRTIKQ